jgi:ankyrin repeat protein
MINRLYNFFKQQALIKAIRGNNIYTVEHLIQSNVFLNKTFGETPLNAAIKTGNLKIIKLLFQNNIHVNESGAEGIFPIQLVSNIIAYNEYKKISVYWEILDLLLSNKANPNFFSRRYYQVPALAYAAFRSHSRLLRILLEHGANADVFWKHQYSWSRLSDETLRLLITYSKNPPQEVVTCLNDIALERAPTIPFP